MIIKATIKIVLGRKPLSNGNYTICLRVIKNRKQKLISLGIECKMEHFVNEQLTKKHPGSDVENEVILKIKSKAMEIIRVFQSNNIDFTLSEFEKKIRGIEPENKDKKVLDFFNEIINDMEKEGRISNADVYISTRVSIEKFAKKQFTFKDITPTFLDKYVVFLREKNNTGGGINLKLRTLRALFNKARKRHIIPKYPYPFEDFNISQFKSETISTALSLEEFKKFYEVDLTVYPYLKDTYNFFVFSLLTGGMNFHDMMSLRWSNIHNNRIYYVRSKTKGKFSLPISQKTRKILYFYKFQKRPTKYVFPILLREGMTPKQISYRKRKVLSTCNRRLKEIAELAKIESKITFYVARHSYANILKYQGTPFEKISELLGHKDVITTKVYLKNFDKKELDEEHEKLNNLI